MLLGWIIRGKLVGAILSVTAVFKWCNYVWLQSIPPKLQELNMYLLILALLLLGLKLAGVEPVEIGRAHV